MHHDHLQRHSAQRTKIAKPPDGAELPKKPQASQYLVSLLSIFWQEARIEVRRQYAILTRKIKAFMMAEKVKDFDDYKQDPRYYLWRLKSQFRNSFRRFMFVPARYRNLPKKGSKNPHWVLSFYGIDRSLQYTAYGIMKHIIRPLVRHGVDVTVLAHFNKIETIDPSPYGKEGNVSFTRDYISALNPDVLWVEMQNSNLIEPEAKNIESVEWKIKGDMFKSAKQNLLFQLHSLSRLVDLINLTDIEDFDVFAVMRADLQYIDDIDVGHLQDLIKHRDVDLVTPIWQKWGGLNDRFAFLSARAVLPILRRRHLVSDFARERGYIHAEELLLYAAERSKLRLSYTDQRAERVRGNGRVQFEPFDAQ